jgi:hypothetical protein
MQTVKIDTNRFNTLERLAIAVATAAPRRKNKWARKAAIPWEIVDDIRQTLDAIDVDWRNQK